MKLNYYPETDSLYIDLSEITSIESKEISEGVVIDYDDSVEPLSASTSIMRAEN